MRYQKCTKCGWYTPFPLPRRKCPRCSSPVVLLHDRSKTAPLIFYSLSTTSFFLFLLSFYFLFSFGTYGRVHWAATLIFSISIALYGVAYRYHRAEVIVKRR